MNPDRQAKKILLILNLLVLAGILFHSIYRDIQLKKQYPGDLRNRIVGARLQQDGISPYFYKWKHTDGTRYIDTQNDDSLKVSNITASPFFHELLYPICNLPQRTISKLWLWFEYIMLACISLMFINLSKNNLQQLMILNITVIFTCTEAWKALIANGQIYLFVALLIALIIYGLLKSEKLNHVFAAAVGAAMLVLVRPISLVLFIPFLFVYNKTYKFIAATGAMLVIYGLFVLINQKEKNYWSDYYKGLQEQVKVHQGKHPTLQKNERPPAIRSLEGFDWNEIRKSYKEHPYPVYSENGNVFVLYNIVTHKKIPVSIMSIMFVISAVLLLTLFFILKKQHDWRIEQILLLAFLLYMLAELFNPIYRHQYNTVQWLPLLLLAVIWLEEFPIAIAFLLLAGLVLNIINTSWIPMRHTIGEYLWLLALISIVFRKPVVKKINF